MEKEEENGAFLTTVNSGFLLVLCSAEKTSTAGRAQSLKFLGMGDRTPLIPLSLVMQVAEGVSVAGWAGLLQMAQRRRVSPCSVCMGKVVFVLGVNPFFHLSQYLLTRCLHRTCLTRV